MSLSLRGVTSGLLLLSLGACAPPPEAPEDLSTLNRYLYREWSNPDDAVVAEGLRNLEKILIDDLGINEETSVFDRSWSVDLLTDEDVADIKRPDRPLSDTFGVALAHMSPLPVQCHARMQAETDQLPVEPTAVKYVRSFPNTETPTCLADRNCDVLDTVNDARRENAAIAADFILFKSFRNVDYELDDGRERTAFFSRSWFEEPFYGEGGSHLLQSYSTDVWIQLDDGKTIRHQILWSETEINLLGSLVSYDLQTPTVTNATKDAMFAADKHIGGFCP